MGGGIFVLLTLMVPFSAAYLQHRISKSAIWERRRELSAERDRWDREERERQLTSDRLAGSMDLLQAKLNDIERRRDALRAKHRALEERIQTLAQQRLAALERERRDGLRFANDLYATLAQAHCLYIQAALRRKKYHLLPVPPWDRLREHSLALVPLERSNGQHGTRSPD